MSHAEPDLAQDYKLPDMSDLFVFGGTSGTVLVMTGSPLFTPGGFLPGAQYCWHIDTDGDNHPDVTFRVSFGPWHDGAQPVTLSRADRPGACDRDADGMVLAAGITGRPTETPAGIRLWAGEAANPNWLNGGVLDSAAKCIREGVDAGLLAAHPVLPMNLLARTNVQAIAAEIPGGLPAAGRDSVWATTASPGPDGWRQHTRCALPLLSTLFSIDDEAAGLNHNGTGPHQDLALYGHIIRAGAARAAMALGTARDPLAHGAQVAETLLPDVLPYRPGTPASFRSWPVNGRGLTDPAAEAMISRVLGAAITFGLDATSVTGSLRGTFPYLASPAPWPEQDPLQF